MHVHLELNYKYKLSNETKEQTFQRVLALNVPFGISEWNFIQQTEQRKFVSLFPGDVSYVV